MPPLLFYGQDARNSDDLENYEILEEIGKSETSIVYLALCKRGRLRDRKVALKRIPRPPPPSTSAATSFESSALIHQALHHPVVVSLFSIFMTESFYYHVMELCSRGTLSDFLRTRSPPVLSEAELRGLVKTLVDALAYLKKELVLHRNIQAANLLMADDYQVKLSNFCLAIRLPPLTPVTCSSTGYESNQVTSRTPCDFSTDVWSLGCLMITCLSGTSLFEANSAFEILKNISNVSYVLPPNISSEAKDLVLNLLSIIPEQRMPLESILSHSFFDPKLPVHSLRPVSHSGEGNLVGKKLTNTSNTGLYHPDALAPPKDRRCVDHDMENTDVRHLLKKEISSNINGHPGSSRRVVSDPLPPKGSLTSEFFAVKSRARASLAVEIPSVIVGSQRAGGDNSPDEPLKSIRLRCALRPLPGANLSSEGRQNTAWIQDNLVDEKENCMVPSVQTHAKYKRKESYHPVSERATPIGTTRPMPLKTSPLRPQTHKMVHGQVTILPSQSVLIDLREGERRKGRRGDEVFVVDADGSNVKIYSAPHLSSPCLLVEPVANYPIQELPPCYWRQYNDARQVLEQIKQVTPMLVMYDENAKCTLMSNVPEADIEILHPCSPPLVHQKGRRIADSAVKEESFAPKMRIRYSRHHHSVEIARFLSTMGPQSMGEWTKKVFNAVDGRTGIREADRTALDDTERAGMKDLEQFVRICEAVERLSEKTLSPKPTIKTPNKQDKSDGVLGSGLPPDRGNISAVTNSATTSHTKGPLAFTVAPRPIKLSSILSRSNGRHSTRERESFKCDSTLQQQMSGQAGILDRAHWSHDEYSDELNHTAGIQSRFLPSVGWCIRYGSRVSQGGRYRIMFLDGVTLDIDADDEYVEFTSRSGDVIRRKVRDCNSQRKIGERMKVFDEFVSMFDRDQTDAWVPAKPELAVIPA